MVGRSKMCIALATISSEEQKTYANAQQSGNYDEIKKAKQIKRHSNKNPSYGILKIKMNI